MILKFDGKTVNHLDDLNHAARQADLTKSIEMVLFRNQKENIILLPANTFRDNKE